MQPTIIGVIVLLLGLAALWSPPAFTLRTALLLSLLGAGAAINLPALGGASILAGPFFTGFVFLRNLLTRGGAWRLLAAFRWPSPGFWLLVAVLYGVFAAFLIGPFYYGEIMVYPISRSTAEGASFALEPFGSSSGNLTQSVYAIGQLLLYGSMTALIVTPRLHRIALDALVLLGMMHVAISVLDLATYYSRTTFLLDWLRTATYASWAGNEVGGVKRISGLFPETSMYSIYAMTILGVMLRLMLSGYRIRVTRPLFYLTLLFLLISTSTTAYAALALAGTLLGLIAVKEATLLARFRILRVILLCALTAVFAGSLAAMIWPGLADRFETVVQETILDKADSDSGQDRSRLNAGAFQTFLATDLLGAGLGSVRTSSFALTLVSNLGLIGGLAFLAFVAGLFGRDRSTAGCGPETLVLARAARWGVVAALLAAATSYHVFDLGPLFYILAALARPRLLGRAAAPRGVPARGPLPNLSAATFQPPQRG